MPETPTQTWERRTLVDNAENAVIAYLEWFGLTTDEAFGIAHHLVASVLFSVGETVMKAKGLDDES